MGQQWKLCDSETNKETTIWKGKLEISWAIYLNLLQQGERNIKKHELIDGTTLVLFMFTSRKLRQPVLLDTTFHLGLLPSYAKRALKVALHGVLAVMV